MLVIPFEELKHVSGAGFISDAAPYVTLAAGMGAGIGSSSAFAGAGGLAGIGTIGAASGAAVIGGFASAFVAGAGFGYWVGSHDCIRDKLSSYMWEMAGTDE